MTTTSDSSLQNRLEQAEAALEEALRERTELWEQLNRRKADEAELQHYREKMAGLEQSKVWRAWKRINRFRYLARVGLARLQNRK